MKKFLTLTFVIIALLINSTIASAAGSGTISASPSSTTKNVNQEFDITIRASANVNFSAVSANISISNLTVVSLSKNSSLSCIKDPSIGSLSFTSCGVVGLPAGYTSINIFTIRVKAPSAGSANINISGGKIVGVDPVEFLSVGYVNGSYTIVVPPTNTPRPTSIATQATATPSITETPIVTENVVTPTATPTVVQLTVIRVLTPDNLPLINSAVTIDDNSYMTDNAGYVEVAGLIVGEHQIKYFIDGKEYNQEFVLGDYTDGKSIVFQIVNTETGESFNSLGTILIISGIILIFNVLAWLLIYKRNSKTKPIEDN